ncbi:hypothetical protein J4558_16720 [Leptolyngbya sp. 15MV]|nr:hypothetical protein J4558_16720 [Leptolyngbya sp. 15MV]
MAKLARLGLVAGAALCSAPALAQNDAVAFGPAPAWASGSEPLAVPDDATGLIFMRRQDVLVHLARFTGGGAAAATREEIVADPAAASARGRGRARRGARRRGRGGGARARFRPGRFARTRRGRGRDRARCGDGIGRGGSSRTGSRRAGRRSRKS